MTDYERMNAGDGFEAAGAEAVGTERETSGGKGSAQIEREIEQTRARMSERLDTISEKLHPSNLALRVPLWTGESLPDGRLLLFFDGGFGDAFQMARWIPPVRDRVESLRLAVGPKLIGLFSEQGWEIELVSWNDYRTGYDRWLNADGLPGLCGCARPEDVPPAPYIQATQTRAPLAGVFKVGLVWAGQPGHPDDGIRSTTLADCPRPAEASGGCG